MKKIQIGLIKLYTKYINREILAYLICGLLTTLISVIIYWLCIKISWSVAVSNTASVVIAVIAAYFLNKIFVFDSVSWDLSILAREIFAFGAGRFATYVLETGLLVLMVDVIKLPNMPCKIFTTILVVIGNYIISKWAVFKKSP